MFAITFDLIVKQTNDHHPKGIAQAYADIGAILSKYGFERIQGSVYVTKDENMALLFNAINALKLEPWLPKSIRDIRAFRIEQWSDFTATIKGEQ
jgi:hypothetical protein